MNVSDFQRIELLSHKLMSATRRHKNIKTKIKNWPDHTALFIDTKDGGPESREESEIFGRHARQVLSHLIDKVWSDVVDLRCQLRLAGVDPDTREVRPCT